VDAYTLTATAYDGQGNLSSFSDTTFSFAPPGAGASLSAAECVTATTGPALGTCSVSLTATVAGSYSVTASLGSTALGGSNPVTGVFVAGSTSASASRVSISAGPKTANGTDAYTITASAYDANGNLNTTPASTFTFSAPGAGASLSANTCSTVAGRCSITLTATVAGSYSITASSGGVPVGGENPLTALFLAVGMDPGQSQVSIDAGQGARTADGVDRYTITARAYDAMGNPNTSQPQTFEFSLSQGALTRRLGARDLTLNPGANPHQWAALSAGTCTTATTGAAAGTCSISLTATYAAWYTISVAMDGIPIGNPPGGQVAGQFIAGPASAAHSLLSISAGTKRADGVDFHTLTVTARDVFDNVQATVPTQFTFSLLSANGASLSAPSCQTLTTGPGAGTCSVLMTATSAGQFAVQAGLNAQPVNGLQGGPVQGQFGADAEAMASVPALHAGSLWVLLLLVPALAARSGSRLRDRGNAWQRPGT